MALAIYFLSELLGVSVVAGVATLLLLVPLQGYIVAKVKGLQVIHMLTQLHRSAIIYYYILYHITIL